MYIGIDMSGFVNDHPHATHILMAVMVGIIMVGLAINLAEWIRERWKRHSLNCSDTKTGSSDVSIR